MIKKCKACQRKFRKSENERPRANRFKFCGPCHLALYPMGGREKTREIVRIRDKRKCKKCGKRWNSKMRRFDVHHLNGLCGKKSHSYDQMESIDGLITYCHRCHLRLHSNRMKMKSKNSRRLTEIKKKKIIELKLTGISAYAIGSKLSLAYPTVFKYINGLRTPRKV